MRGWIIIGPGSVGKLATRGYPCPKSRADQVLIIGYGNPDREDDGVAWHILLGLAESLGRTALDIESGGMDQLGQSPDLLFVLQLTPELAEIIARYDYVCFVDAHTGSYPESLRFEPIDAKFQNSPFTHHMTPQTCLASAEALFGHTPGGISVSVRGHQFGFSHRLSTETAQLAKEATHRIVAWLNSMCFGRVTPHPSSDETPGT